MFRKILTSALALLVLLCGGAVASGPVCVSAPGIVALVDEQGAELIENGRFEQIFTVRQGALYAAGSAADCRLFSADGQAVSDERFAMICDAGDCLIFRRDDGYGVMTASGEVIVDPVWRG